MDSLLQKLKLPEDIKRLSHDQLQQLASEVRDLIIQTVSKNGGHLASNLGIVELTLALLMEFDFCRDQVVFDVGHQAYAWKILTGRLDQFCTLRKLGGLAGFPKRSESCYDFFNTGHSSTSISAALGLSRANSRLGKSRHTIAIIGDGALTGGMAFEALNDAGQSKENLIVILNDNQMSIGKNVGGLSRHLENLRISPKYIRFRSRIDDFLIRIPLIGRGMFNMVQQSKKVTRLLLQRQGILFEQLGFRYYGPIDGHDLQSLQSHLHTIQGMQGPILLHILTQKGKGYRYAEESPDLYHGVAPFIIENGVSNGSSSGTVVKSFSHAFGNHMIKLASQNPQICAISAAMTAGTGLEDFARNYPSRFFDVGIAEQHAVTMAAGLAAGGMVPVVALYSTFLQRAYDQLLHDICLQELPVVIAIDRAGVVGEDGETHQGIYDLGLMLPLPNLEIFCPPDYDSLAGIMDYAIGAGKPVAIRYPRGKVWPQPLPAAIWEDRPDDHDWKQARCLRRGGDITLAVLGSMAGPAIEAAEILALDGIQAEVLAFFCAKPIDQTTLAHSAIKTGRVIFIEENLIAGGFGQSALPDLIKAVPTIRYDLMGIIDQPLCQGTRDQLLTAQKLKPESIAERARQLLGIMEIKLSI